MLIALRDGPQGPFDDAGLAELRVEALNEDAAGSLLEAHAPGLEPALRERLLQEAVGNPLALVELPSALQSGHLGEGPLPPPRLPLTTRLERAFASQESELPAAIRSLLLIATADDCGDLGRGAERGHVSSKAQASPSIHWRRPSQPGWSRFTGPGCGSATPWCARRSTRRRACRGARRRTPRCLRCSLASPTGRCGTGPRRHWGPTSRWPQNWTPPQHVLSVAALLRWRSPRWSARPSSAGTRRAGEGGYCVQQIWPSSLAVQNWEFGAQFPGGEPWQAGRHLAPGQRRRGVGAPGMASPAGLPAGGRWAG